MGDMAGCEVIGGWGWERKTLEEGLVIKGEEEREAGYRPTGDLQPTECGASDGGWEVAAGGGNRGAGGVWTGGWRVEVGWVEGLLEGSKV